MPIGTQMGLYTGNHKKGVMGAIIGALLGYTYKSVGDWLHSNSRTAWLRYRIQTLNSAPRVLEVRKPRFKPDNALEGSGSIIPGPKSNSTTKKE